MLTFNEALIATGGGVLIGISATILLAFNGRVAGISGILEGILPPKDANTNWRIVFLIGMILTGIALSPVLPDAFIAVSRPIWLVTLSGLLVGIGTRMSNGCTSGHGVCGMAMFSKRSFIAVGVFLATGILSATIAGQILGGV
ncbi:MAG: YeeE/YedE thiosulfate transporter family protein [Euryarchaeota archaeon]